VAQLVAHPRALPLLRDQLMSRADGAAGCREQALWALGNVAGAGAAARDAVAGLHGIMAEVERGLGRSVALHHRLSALHQVALREARCRRS
jgi:hypothetical protein